MPSSKRVTSSAKISGRTSSVSPSIKKKERPGIVPCNSAFSAISREAGRKNERLHSKRLTAEYERLYSSTQTSLLVVAEFPVPAQAISLITTGDEFTSMSFKTSGDSFPAKSFARAVNTYKPSVAVNTDDVACPSYEKLSQDSHASEGRFFVLQKREYDSMSDDTEESSTWRVDAGTRHPSLEKLCAHSSIASKTSGGVLSCSGVSGAVDEVDVET